MHHLLRDYINAKYEEMPYCSCPNCFNSVEKKSQNHIFCKVRCKDTFWTKIKGMTYRGWGSRSVSKDPVYPGGYDQWKIDLRRAEEGIVDEIILEEEC